MINTERKLCVCVDLKERQAVIEEMRLVLSEQEETQTQMDLELENRETQIHHLTQGTTLHHHVLFRFYSKTHTFQSCTSVNIQCVFVCLELENLKELLLKQRYSKQLHHHEPARSDDITRAKEEAAQAQDDLKVRI